MADQVRAVVAAGLLAGLLVTAAPVQAEPTPTGSTSAEARERVPVIKRREAWGAAPFRGTPTINRRITRGVVHHTVNRNTYRRNEVPAMLRSIQAFHQGDRGWPDIAYNFIVDRFGRIWEGRDRSYEDPVRVSATSGPVRRTVTVAYLGDGSTTRAPSEAVRAMARLLGWKLRHHGLEPTRANIVAHGEIGQTSCPGEAMLRQVPNIETRAIAYGN